VVTWNETRCDGSAYRRDRFQFFGMNGEALGTMPFDGIL
jgi:hypothetical protein